MSLNFMKRKAILLSLTALLTITFPFSPMLISLDSTFQVNASKASIAQTQDSPEITPSFISGETDSGILAASSNEETISTGSRERQVEQDFIAKSLDSLNRPVSELMSMARAVMQAQEKNPHVLQQAFQLLSLAYPAIREIGISSGDYSYPSPSGSEINPEQYAAAPLPGIRQATPPWIVFASNRLGNYDIYRMNYDGTGQIPLTTNPKDDWQPAFSPNGRKIAFSSIRDGNYEIYVMNYDGSGHARLTNHSAVDLWPTWSLDGSQIIFISARDGGLRLWKMSATAGDSTASRVTSQTAWEVMPNRSPISTVATIAFTSWAIDGGEAEIFRVNPDGSDFQRLTNTAGLDFGPAFSPDGSKIVFTTTRDGNYEIYRMNALDGSGLSNLTNHTAWDFMPRYSPDGTQIVFVSDRSGGIFQVFTMKSDGTEVSPPLTTSGMNIDPHWGVVPDLIPPPTPTLIEPANGATIITPVGVPATVTFDWSDVTDDTMPVTYELRVATNSALSNPVLNKAGLPTSGYTASGAEALAEGVYYWSARAYDGVASPYTNIGSFASPFFTFTVTSQVTVATGFYTGFNMFSIPAHAQPNTPIGQLGDDFSPVNVFHYMGIYKMFTFFTPGSAYWTRVGSDVTVDFVGIPVSKAANYDIPLLTNDWNQIGNPFLSNVRWGDVRVKKVGEPDKSITEAHTAGWLVRFIYRYDANTGIYETRNETNGILAPAAGYWVRSLTSGLSLSVPPPP